MPKYCITNIKTVVICPDHNKKYAERKTHMASLLKKIGVENVVHHKSGTDAYPKCLSEAIISILEENMTDDPIIILEDDVEWTGLYTLEIPVNTDAIYLGLSLCGGSKTENKDDGPSTISLYSQTQVKVVNMLAAHAILYFSKRYKQAVVNELKNHVDWHADVVMSKIQNDFNVLAQKIPFFYQSSGFGNVQHVENMTKVCVREQHDPTFSFNTDPCTLVTCYYPVKTGKHSEDAYMSWIKNFMKLNSPVVVFTTQDYEKKIKTLREDRPIHIEIIDFEELYMWKKYSTQWIKNYDIDPEKHIHSPALYAVWAQKAVFIKDAITLNPFKSTHFFWCDIGAFRIEADMPLYKTFPMTSYFQQEKILFGSVFPLTQDDKTMRSDGIIGDFLDPTKCRIIGGLWGGDIKGCFSWVTAYEKMLNKYFDVGRFAGKDQSVMMSTWLENPGLGFFIKPRDDARCNDDLWFYLEKVLSGREPCLYA